MTRHYRRIEGALRGLSTESHSLAIKWLEDKRRSVTPGTLKAIQTDLAHWSKYCDKKGAVWLPTSSKLLRRYVRQYQNQRSNGAIQRLVVYLRALNRTLGTNLDDVVLDQVLVDLGMGEKYLRRQPIRAHELETLTGCLSTGLLSKYTRALLWTVYDTQFRISSLLQVRLEDLKVFRPGGEVWLPPPRKAINWEEDGGFLPPSTACHIRDWFNEVGIEAGYIFPRLNKGKATDEIATTAHARHNVLSSFVPTRRPKSMSFRAIREGAISDITEADIGIPLIMRRGRLDTYRSAKRLLSGSENLDGSSLEMARLQSRWVSPSGY